VVLVDGEAALYVERNGKGLVTMPAFERVAPVALAALRGLAENASRRELSIERVDGEAVLTSPLRGQLEQAGFAREYLGLTLRAPGLAHPQARSA
jgi:ATP-dependent Lhr-like helicase